MKTTNDGTRLGRDRRTGVFYMVWRDAAGRRRRRSLGTCDAAQARRAVGGAWRAPGAVGGPGAAGGA